VDGYLVTDQLDLFIVYNETGGFVERPASVDRAMHEIATGKLSERQAQVLDLLDDAGFCGLTWNDCGTLLGLHHGQISGALSNLHGCGQVFALREVRDRSHPYVHIKYRDRWDADARYDEPVRTRNSRQRELQAQLLEAVREAIDDEWSQTKISIVTAIVGMMNDYERGD
jgi:hypothetical protein